MTKQHLDALPRLSFDSKRVRFGLFVLLLPLLLTACAGTGSDGEESRREAPDRETVETNSEGPRIEPPSDLSPLENPPAKNEIQKAFKRGKAFLIKHQNEDGSWGTPEKTKELNIYAPVPGGHHAFHSASTALCLMGLLEGSSNASGKEQKAIHRAGKWLLDFLPRLRRATPDAIYNVWGHAFSLQALVRLLDAPSFAERYRQKIRTRIKQQIRQLKNYEFVRGGWGYYDFRVGSDKPAGQPNSFTTATVLIALKEAQNAGFHVPSHLITRGLRVIKRQQNPNFSYLYSAGHQFYPMYDINRPAGSLGRSQACNAALRMWGDEEVTDRVLRAWLDRLFLRKGWLDIGRKRPVPHESWFAVAGYFYYYGHFYSTYCMRQLPRKDQTLYAKHAAKMYLEKQEEDGSWWDYPLYNYHKFYGTGFALTSLARIGQMYPDPEETDNH